MTEEIINDRKVRLPDELYVMITIFYDKKWSHFKVETQAPTTTYLTNCSLVLSPHVSP